MYRETAIIMCKATNAPAMNVIPHKIELDHSHSRTGRWIAHGMNRISLSADALAVHPSNLLDNEGGMFQIAIDVGN